MRSVTTNEIHRRLLNLSRLDPDSDDKLDVTHIHDGAGTLLVTLFILEGKATFMATARPVSEGCWLSFYGPTGRRIDSIGPVKIDYEKGQHMRVARRSPRPIAAPRNEKRSPNVVIKGSDLANLPNQQSRAIQENENVQ